MRGYMAFKRLIAGFGYFRCVRDETRMDNKITGRVSNLLRGVISSKFLVVPATKQKRSKQFMIDTAGRLLLPCLGDVSALEICMTKRDLVMYHSFLFFPSIANICIGYTEGKVPSCDEVEIIS